MRSWTLVRIPNSRFCGDWLHWLSLRHPIRGDTAEAYENGVPFLVRNRLPE
jgi:hypothetical protein